MNLALNPAFWQTACYTVVLMPYNGLRLCDGGEIEAEKLNLLLMFNQGTNAEFCTSTPLLQNRCYVPYFFKIWNTKISIMQVII